MYVYHQLFFRYVLSNKTLIKKGNVMKKMIALMAAVAVFGMGNIAQADPPTAPLSGMNVQWTAFTSTPDQYGEDVDTGGGIQGTFGMAAYSGSLGVPDTEQPIGTGVVVSGGSDLTLYDDDITAGDAGCGACNDEDEVIGQTGGSLGVSLYADGGAGYGDVEGVGVAWAGTTNMSVVTSTGDAEGFAGIGASAASSNGEVGAYSGGGLTGILFHP